MGWMEDLIPNEWERTRWKIRLGAGGAVLLVLMWLACLPGMHARARVQAARKGMQAVAKQLEQYRQQHGHYPAHMPLPLSSKLKATMISMGATEVTSFIPGELKPAATDPYTPAEGSENFAYFGTQGEPQRWFLASMGPDRIYQLRSADIAAFAQQGPAALAHLTYDPTNGADSVGDIVLTGP